MQQQCACMLTHAYSCLHMPGKLSMRVGSFLRIALIHTYEGTSQQQQRVPGMRTSWLTIAALAPAPLVSTPCSSGRMVNHNGL